VTARVDYCNMVLASSPRYVTDKLQGVLNAAAHLVSGKRKYDRGLSLILHADLHWLDVADRVRYKLGVTVHRCLHNKAPQYLVDCCIPASDIASCQWLRSARRCLLTVAHSAVGHSQSPNLLSGTCFQTNSETDCTEFTFWHSLKTFFFNQYWCIVAHYRCYDYAPYKSTFYLLTYYYYTTVNHDNLMVDPKKYHNHYDGKFSK